MSKSKVDKATFIAMLHPDRTGKVIYFGTTETYYDVPQILKDSPKE